MAIALYKKGLTHIVDERHCTVVLVPTNEDRRALLEQGDHFDTVEELYAPAVEEKPKKGRKSNPVVGAEEVVKSDETETEAGSDEDENTAH
jgi:hypothetical protein